MKILRYYLRSFIYNIMAIIYSLIMAFIIKPVLKRRKIRDKNGIVISNEWQSLID